MKQCLNFIRTRNGTKSKEYLNKHGHLGAKEFYVLKSIVYPIQGIKTVYSLLSQQDICDYTLKGRENLHTKLGFIDKEVLYYFSHNPDINKSVEFNDNQSSLYCAQQGKCLITGKKLDENDKVLYATPPQKGGLDAYKNLVLVTGEIYSLVQAKDIKSVMSMLQAINLDTKALKKINTFRKKIGNDLILGR